MSFWDELKAWWEDFWNARPGQQPKRSFFDLKIGGIPLWLVLLAIVVIFVIALTRK